MAGYVAALSIILLVSLLESLKILGHIKEINLNTLFLLVVTVLFIMLITEYYFKKKYNTLHKIKNTFSVLSPSNNYILLSTFYRMLALSFPVGLALCIVNYIPYFSNNIIFLATKLFFNYFLIIFIFISPLYIFFTLKYRGDLKYEFNDYAILTIIGFRSLWKKYIVGSSANNFHTNKRVRKVLLVYLVNFFFLTLMVHFLVSEFTAFEQYLNHILEDDYFKKPWFYQVKNTYNILFHTLFLVDVTIAIVGYISASRWLDNRTKSVDMTCIGWLVTLACYPPFNSFVYDNFLDYNKFETTSLIESQWVITIILILLLVLYSIYVWGTIALGFKFSNLTNRGIISTGPYRFVRHPAYASKNISWIIDHTYVFTNIWATFAFLSWNALYIMRAITEEKHLGKDKTYVYYKKRVKYMFIPKII